VNEMPKRTATQKSIDNINSYINKVGSFFGVNSPEYRNITNKLTPFETYENKKGFTVIANNKANRKLHQKIRALNNSKPSFARQKRRYQKEVDRLRKEFEPEIEEPNIEEPNIEEPNIENSSGGGGGGAPAIDFDTWFNNWRQTWSDSEQYEVAELANQLGVPFDYNQWYTDYAYREQMRHDLYNAWLGDITNEVNDTDTVNGYTVDSDSGEMFDYTNDDIDGGNIYD
jgi:hypothetical protein